MTRRYTREGRSRVRPLMRFCGRNGRTDGCGTLVKYPQAQFFIFFSTPSAFSSSTKTLTIVKKPPVHMGNRPASLSPPPSATTYMLSGMDPFVTLVPGSRRPFKFFSPKPPPPNQVAQTQPQDMSMRPQVTPPSTSTRRRKPTITFRSPSVEFAPHSLNDPNVSVPMQDESMDNGNASSYSPVQADSSSSSSSPSPRTPSSSSLTSLLTEPSSASSFAKPLSTREVYAMAPPLPLYHPLGALALRLPLLGESPKTPHVQLADPTPSKPIQTAASSRPRNNTGTNRNRNAGRSRRTTAAKSRDVPADADPLIADEKDQEEFVATHRRRRNGPSASTSLSASTQTELIAAEGRKRKRREVDTGDPGTSPPTPKRSRQPRTGTSASTPNNPASPTPSFVQLRDRTPDAMEIEEDEEPPLAARTNGRRRNARSSGRRNSTRRAGPKKEKERTPSSDEVSYGQRSAVDRPQTHEASGEPTKEAEGDGDSPSDGAIVSSHSPPIVAPVPTHLTKNALEGLSMSAANVGDRTDGAGPAYI